MKLTQSSFDSKIDLNTRECSCKVKVDYDFMINTELTKSTATKWNNIGIQILFSIQYLSYKRLCRSQCHGKLDRVEEAQCDPQLPMAQTLPSRK